LNPISIVSTLGLGAYPSRTGLPELKESAIFLLGVTCNPMLLLDEFLAYFHVKLNGLPWYIFCQVGCVNIFYIWGSFYNPNYIPLPIPNRVTPAGLVGDISEILDKLSLNCLTPSLSC